MAAGSRSGGGELSIGSGWCWPDAESVTGSSGNPASNGQTPFRRKLDLQRGLKTVFGWRLLVDVNPNDRSLRNFPVQAKGAVFNIVYGANGLLWTAIPPPKYPRDIRGFAAQQSRKEVAGRTACHQILRRPRRPACDEVSVPGGVFLTGCRLCMHLQPADRAAVVMLAAAMRSPLIAKAAGKRRPVNPPSPGDGFCQHDASRGCPYGCQGTLSLGWGKCVLLSQPDREDPARLKSSERPSAA